MNSQIQDVGFGCDAMRMSIQYIEIGVLHNTHLNAPYRMRLLLKCKFSFSILHAGVT